jgi:metal-sulfur cluster biosynthetic enzyme
MDNPNPVIFDTRSATSRQDSFDDCVVDEIDAQECYELIKTINDPEHPVTLEQLQVVRPEHIYLCQGNLLVHFTPTIPHCSMATLIGLCIQIKLQRSLPAGRFRILVQIRPGTHNSESAINRQLADKERVAAATENSNLKRVVAACLMGPPRSGIAL